MGPLDPLDPSAILRAFGSALAELRVERGLTQVEVARRAGLHQSAVCNIENARHNPKLTIITRLAWALDMAPAELVRACLRSAWRYV